MAAASWNSSHEEDGDAAVYQARLDARRWIEGIQARVSSTEPRPRSALAPAAAAATGFQPAATAGHDRIVDDALAQARRLLRDWQPRSQPLQVGQEVQQVLSHLLALPLPEATALAQPDAASAAATAGDIVSAADARLARIRSRREEAQRKAEAAAAKEAARLEAERARQAALAEARRLAREQQLLAQIEREREILRKTQEQRRRERQEHLARLETVASQLKDSVVTGRGGSSSAIQDAASSASKTGPQNVINSAQPLHAAEVDEMWNRRLVQAKALRQRHYQRLQSQCFYAWLRLAAESRMILARFTTARDTRHLFRLFCRWRRIHQKRRHQRLLQEAQRLELNDEKQRMLADKHFRQRQLVRCLHAWKAWAHQRKKRRQLKAERQAQMEALLVRLQQQPNFNGQLPPQDRPLIQQSPNQTQPSGPAAPRTALTPSMDSAPAKVVSQSPTGTSRSVYRASSARNHTADSIRVLRHVNSEEGRAQPSSSHKPARPGAAITSTDLATATAKKPEQSGNIPHGPTTEASATLPKPAFLQAMEERQARRAELRATRLARAAERQQMAEEQRRLAAEEEARRIAEEERAALEAKRQARREREERLRRQAETKAEAEAKADRALTHHRHSLLRKYGLEPWLVLWSRGREEREKGDAFWAANCQRRWWQRWRHCYAIKETQKAGRALAHFRFQQLRRVFDGWRAAVAETHSAELLARRTYLHHVRRRLFAAWRQYSRAQIESTAIKERRAGQCWRRLLLLRTFAAWRGFVPLERREKEKERRRAALRQQVASVLPDFHPTTG